MKKAPGPEGISPRLLNVCRDQLAAPLTSLYNWSLKARKVPLALKESIVIPVPKKKTISCLNDYRPVALTSIVMKAFETLVLQFIKRSLPPGMDKYQFAYRSNRSTEDAVAIGLHHVLQHLEPSR